MTKASAINYLKFLHDLETEYSKDLFTSDLQKLVEKIRLDFIEAYNDKKGI